jgi:RHS repeat-associated protein
MTYDDNGNLRTLKEAGQTTTYTWDARDRLVALSGPGLSASFAYDAEGRRTSKTITGFSTTFQYDGLDIAKEVAGGATVSYLRNLQIDETLARIQDDGALCYAPDALGSTLALADANAGVSTEYTYEPFGNTVVTGNVSQNALQFAGRENDGTGLYHFRARYYATRPQRFVSEDPLGLRGGVNLYAYASNTPTSRRDPLGLKDGPPCDCPGGTWSGVGVSALFALFPYAIQYGIYRVCCWSSDKCCTIEVRCGSEGGSLAAMAGITPESMWMTDTQTSSGLAGKSPWITGGIGIGKGGKGPPKYYSHPPRVGAGASGGVGPSSPSEDHTDPATQGTSGTFGVGLGVGAGVIFGTCRTRILNCE